MPDYRFVEDLHNVHKGEEIWVLGCGPSLDDFPDNFFDEKYRIAIASTWSLVAFPNCTYSAFSRGQKGHLEHVLEKGRQALYKCIVRLTPIEVKNKIFIGPEPIYLRINQGVELGGSFSQADRDYNQQLAKKLIDGTQMSFASAGTCIHSEMQVAIVMGAKKVTLVGCETKLLKFQGHAYKRGMDKIYKEHDRSRMPKVGFPDHYLAGNSPSQQRVRAGTTFLARTMKPHGIQIARYYYDKGYELIA